MDWTEKFQALLKGLSYAQVEREVGWSANSTSERLKKRHAPRASDGIKLAKLLNVATEWLFDDKLGMPPWPHYDTVKAQAEKWEAFQAGRLYQEKPSEDGAYQKIRDRIRVQSPRPGSRPKRRTRG